MAAVKEKSVGTDAIEALRAADVGILLFGTSQSVKYANNMLLIQF